MISAVSFHFNNVFVFPDELLFYYDASVKCFSKEHLALFIPSTIIFVLLVLPMPFFIILSSHGFIRVSPHVSDVITKGYKLVCLLFTIF